MTECAHSVSDIIQNLEFDGRYYQKKRMCYRIKVMDNLYGLLRDGDGSGSNVDDDGKK